MVDEPRSSVLPAVIGIAVTCVFLLVVGYVAQRRMVQQDAVPQLTITTPLANAAVDSPLAVRFTTAQPIALSPSGWGYGALHVHAWVNDVQYMPAAADIRPVGERTYELTLPAVPRRESLRVRLGWANAAHAGLSQGSSQDVPLVVN